ncbi:putative Late nodulin [Medicago truncatula]|uniref:Putative Late nodulin n=1 Tax=Medicago truncatula TaxID=3880 RepID=A0A396I4F8_MEDTR|nr:putative Late nodulin [Medicago truncatula]
MKMRIHMAQIIMFFYALIIFLSPFLVDRRSFPSSFVSPKSYTSEIPCKATRDCPYELYYETKWHWIRG